ncbi:hypothetical protein WA556_001746, partial [Blastocystis sp. ATCC 50177/Nand II]
MEPQVLVLDNGGSTIKAGLASSADPPCIVPNTTARIRKSLHELIGDDTVSAVTDHSQLMYHRPIEKGYVVNWDYEAKIWNQLLDERHLNLQPQNCYLFLSQPLFNMDELMKGTLEVVFEHFRFGGFCSSPAPLWSFAMECGTLPESDVSRQTASGLVIESGFSFTHIVPIIDGKVVLEGVKRVNVGGKLLTNLLKENLSFRQVNVQDCTHLVNGLKEKFCFVSMDALRELDVCRQSPLRLRKAFVLPDYVTSSTGFELMPGEKVSPTQQVITMLNERFMVPEALFHPSDIGIRQAGIAESVELCLQLFPPSVQQMLVRNIVLSGGNTCLPHFKERFESEIVPVIRDGMEHRIIQLADPIGDTWRGGAAQARNPEFLQRFVTKEMYEENGA